MAASVKKPSSTNSSKDCPTTQQGEGCTLGLTKEQPADSCYHIFTCNPQGQSGVYWIRNGPTAEEGAHQFFCELEEERCGLRGLMRVAHINMSEPCFTCPPPLVQYWANGTKICGSADRYDCDTVVFPVHGVGYNYVCVRAVGHSFYFYMCQLASIEFVSVSDTLTSLHICGEFVRDTRLYVFDTVV